MKKVLIGLAALVVVFLVVAAMQPSDFKVERSASIQATPQTVFKQINSFRNWEAWSPWAKKDPNAKVAYEGAESGVGASFSWDGNHDVGAGKMTITESVVPSLVKINLEFLKPFKGTNLTVFKVTPEGSGTNVTWTMSGQKNYISKMMCLVMSMDKMVGGDFEKGLASMKAIAESSKQM